MQTEPTYYEILQVREDASPAIIKAAYRQLMKSVHPDVNANAPTPAAAVNEARDVLSDPDLRRQYDDDLLAERGNHRREAGAEDPGGRDLGPTDPGGTGPGAADSGASGHGPSDRGHTASGMWGQESPWAPEEPFRPSRAQHTPQPHAHPPPPGQPAPGPSGGRPWPDTQSPPGPPTGHFRPRQGPYTAEADSAQWGFVSPHEGEFDHPPQYQTDKFAEPSSSPRRIPNGRLRWLSQWPIAAWVVLWLGAQAVSDALTGREWTGLLFVAGFLLIGWLAARKRSRGGLISKRYGLWLSVGVVMISAIYLSSPPTALLFGFVYLTWILSAEWANRLSRR